MRAEKVEEEYVVTLDAFEVRALGLVIYQMVRDDGQFYEPRKKELRVAEDFHATLNALHVPSADAIKAGEGR
jgi:hypothetical protein